MLRILLQFLKILAIAALALLVVLGTVRFFRYAVSTATPRDIGEPIPFTITEDEADADLADRLADAGLIQNPWLFQQQLRFADGGLIAGNYTFEKGMSQAQIISRITGAAEEVASTGDTGDAPDSFTITIPEGWRTEQIAEEYARLGGAGGYDAFMEAVYSVDRSQYWFLADLPGDQGLEGYLFPDTYRFSGTDPALNVATMLTNFGSKYDEEMQARTAEVNLTVHQVVTMASIVEREAVLPAERPIIADVYLSRWEQGWTLDSDPSIQYALGHQGNWWPTLTGDDTWVESPYNMYRNGGIPPGPICNPGFASMQAVLFPEETDYMFFVAKGDSGEHAFAVTLDEQTANIEKYLNNEP